MLGPTLVKPNRGFIIPVTIVIDEYFFAGFYEPDGSDADEPLLKIHFIFTVGLVGVIVERDIPEGHAAVLAMVSPLEDVIM
jgi:hypothetical protein